MWKKKGGTNEKENMRVYSVGRLRSFNEKR